jgi:hypothetical protein
MSKPNTTLDILNAIEDARIERGRSKKHIGIELGKSETYWNALLHQAKKHGRGPSIKTLLAVAHLLHCEIVVIDSGQGLLQYVEPILHPSQARIIATPETEDTTKLIQDY